MLLCLSVTFIFAQSSIIKKADKYTESNLRDYFKSLSVYPSWGKAQDYLYYTYEGNNGNEYYYVDLKRHKSRLMFKNSDLASKIMQFTHKAIDIPNMRIGSIEFEKEDRNLLYFHKDGKDFKYNMQTGVLQTYKKVKEVGRPFNYSSGVEKYAPDSSCYVYAYHHNIFLVNKGDTIKHKLTDDGENFHSYSYSSREDSDKKTGACISWSPDSKYFYSFRKNSKDVKDLWVINSLNMPRPSLRIYKFPMPGEKNVFTYDLHIFYPSTLEHKVIDISKYPDQEVKMSFYNLKDQSKYLYFTRKSRTCDEFDLCKVDTETAEVTEIVSETSKPYWMDQIFEYDILNKGKDIIWWSERTGYGQYYLYNNEGKLKNAITKGEFVAGKILKIDTLGRNIIFEAYGKDKKMDPYYRQYYKVNLDGTGLTLLTPGDGYHDISISPNGKYLFDTYSRVDMQPVQVVRDMKGKIIAKVQKYDLTSLYATGWKKPMRFKVKAADNNTDLYGVMYKPFDFDSTKLYPIISNVYPGPQAEYVQRTFAIDDNYNQSLAQLGFIVITVGHRGGSPYRPKWYHNFGYENLRDYPLADDKYAIEQLAQRYNFIDINKVGIYGHSGGGFMSTAAILTYPDFYKVAVSASGNHDNNIYTLWWGETHHGVKMETIKSKDKSNEKSKDKKDSKDTNGEIKDSKNISTYKFSAKIPTNIELAANLKGHLCLITGDIDVNVHMASTLRMADALIKNNKRFDLFIMPGKDHGLGSTYYINLIRYYFLENLLGIKMNNVNL